MDDLQIEPKCLGSVYGVVGKIRFLPGLRKFLEKSHFFCLLPADFYLFCGSAATCWVR